MRGFCSISVASQKKRMRFDSVIWIETRNSLHERATSMSLSGNLLPTGRLCFLCYTHFCFVSSYICRLDVLFLPFVKDFLPRFNQNLFLVIFNRSLMSFFLSAQDNSYRHSVRRKKSSNLTLFDFLSCESFHLSHFSFSLCVHFLNILIVLRN